MKEDAAEVISNREDRIKELEAELKELLEFKMSKDRLMGKMEKLSASLEKEKTDHAQHVADLERVRVAEKETLKKEMVMRIRETKANLLSMTEDQLHATTKRTIMENEQMAAELAFQAKEAERLLRRNQRLMDDTKSLKRDLELQENMNKELAKRTHFYGELTKRLHEKIKRLEEEAAKAGPARGLETAGTMGTMGSLPATSMALDGMPGPDDEMVGLLREKISQLEVNLDRVCGELDATRLRLEATASEHHRVMSVQDETVSFLFKCVSDLKLLSAPSSETKR
jgi:hypothetical protein